ncbi:DUF896 domain-containing protein [Metabacillus arenae]|uniref:UPF0291 protein IC621_03655 n=1 Tax=Metabacillus arenae TaxID=2771434 RepID=A0A926N9N4_9BACI|nr:DUF896 domain-containing protein [Metabacillus arenae]MBD1379319.1 DUF896 domain-containing protein [Metabacillus arenae]
MLSKDKIARINQLSKKSKTVGLSNIESKEQQQLREEYLKSFRKSMKKTLKNVKVVDPEGNDVTPNKLKQEQNKNFH